ncbi:hypothetical protein I0Q91_12195 [Halanaerobiaceae bacterium Z-7014]|uniref:Intracellular proteinase inhibitor BsuPI domain-containing protein n=1 Tax=Halonatronomonas betaini TaxID=2778430 RepID=A0A931FAQ2_9FIRM|nr:BsuPI-related putative proteinase inhibitor [Halonatronomonas betaini]MBF8437849.1 hypothetical protein [Halonatronomonas betaini]
MLNKILPAIFLITALIIATGAPAASNGVQPREDWIDRLEPIIGEFELEENNQVLNLPIQQLDGENYINLEMLGYLFDWTVSAGEEEGVITIEKADNDQQIEFELTAEDFNGRQLVRSPIEHDGAIYIGPALTRYLVASLEDQNVNFIAWLELTDQHEQTEGRLNYNVKLWNIAERPQVLNFMSGQTLELYLLSNSNIEWKLSEDRAYTMALRDIELEPDELKSWDESAELPDRISGEYILAGEITAQPSLSLNQLELVIE